MNTPHPDAEEALELETITLFQHLGWETANCWDEKFGEQSTPGPHHSG